jgi:hypothetical protein
METLDVRFAELFDAARSGELDRGRALVAELVAEDGRWRDYLVALGRLDHLPHADELLSAS